MSRRSQDAKCSAAHMARLCQRSSNSHTGSIVFSCARCFCVVSGLITMLISLCHVTSVTMLYSSDMSPHQQYAVAVSLVFVTFCPTVVCKRVCCRCFSCLFVVTRRIVRDFSNDCHACTFSVLMMILFGHCQPNGTSIDLPRCCCTA